MIATLQPPKSLIAPTDRYAPVVNLRPATAVDTLDAAFARGDELALRDAYESHGAVVYSFCRRTLPEGTVRYSV